MSGNGSKKEPGPLIRVNRTELVWPGKYNADGTRKEVPRANLPFQVIETINESRATREVRAAPQASLFDVWEGKEGQTFDDGWRNKLIWGDNLPIMGALLGRFAGQVDLIYVDPPFLAGADFKFVAPIGNSTEGLSKDRSLVEEKAYWDTWGRGESSYLQMLHQRLVLLRELLSPSGSLFLHIGPKLAHMVRMMGEEVFGSENFQNEIIWQRHDPHNDAKTRLGVITDRILWFSRSKSFTYNAEVEREELSASALKEFSLLETESGEVVPFVGNETLPGRRFKVDDATWKGTRAERQFSWRGARPSPKREWMYDLPGMEEALASGELYLRDPRKGAARCRKKYLDQNLGIYLQDLWTSAGRMKGGSEYPTQKPERLIRRIVRIASKPGDLVADFFAGSGTLAIAAELEERRWICCDLSRYAIHLSRKRLLEIENCKPFEVLNLGKYERQFWQGINFGEDLDDDGEIALYEYLAFILKLYGASPMSGTEHIHGRRDGALVHVGAVDSPVTIDEVSRAIEECLALRQKELHVLGWEWEMGLAGPNNDYRKGGLLHEKAKERGVKLLLLQIPREVMEQQAVDKGDITFFELAYLDAEANLKGLTVTLKLRQFVIPNTELIPEDVRSKITKWSDYIDYWAIDWDFQNDTFMQGWVNYRTRKDRKLALNSDPHTYPKPGAYRILVKVIDIFGNDTTQAYDIQVG